MAVSEDCFFAWLVIGGIVIFLQLEKHSLESRWGHIMCAGLFLVVYGCSGWLHA